MNIYAIRMQNVSPGSEIDVPIFVVQVLEQHIIVDPFCPFKLVDKLAEVGEVYAFLRFVLFVLVIQIVVIEICHTHIIYIAAVAEKRAVWYTHGI